MIQRRWAAAARCRAEKEEKIEEPSSRWRSRRRAAEHRIRGSWPRGTRARPWPPLPRPLSGAAPQRRAAAEMPSPEVFCAHKTPRRPNHQKRRAAVRAGLAGPRWRRSPALDGEKIKVVARVLRLLHLLAHHHAMVCGELPNKTAMPWEPRRRR